MKPFADYNDAKESVGVFISEFSGSHPGKEKVCLAAVNVLSFAAGAAVQSGFVPDFGAAKGQVNAPTDPLEICRKFQDSIDAHQGGRAGVGAWDWKSLLVQLIPIALTLLKKYWPWLDVIVPPAPGVDPSPVSQG